jgi:hypothetical protein
MCDPVQAYKAGGHLDSEFRKAMSIALSLALSALEGFDEGSLRPPIAGV